MGRRDRTAPEAVRDDDVVAGCGAGLALRLLQTLAGPPATVTAIRWSSMSPPPHGRRVALETIVTRIGSAGTEGTAAVTWHVRLCDEARTLEEGGVVATVPADSALHDVARDFATPAWGQEIARRLATHDGFTEATSAFDGAIGLAAGDEAVQLRIYRSRVLECTRWTPAGPTFTVAGNELAWLELAEAPRNDYIARAMLGQFRASGNTHEYLRMTKALVCVWDVTRALSAESSP